MTSTLTPSMTTTNRSSQEKPGLSRADALMVRAAVASFVAACKGKPQPDDFWYDLTRDDAELRNLHLDALVVRGREALAHAKKQGIGIQAATVHRIEIAFATLCALTVHGYEVDGEGSFATDLVRLSEETADVVTAAARAAHEPSPRNLEALRYEINEAIDIGETVADRTALQLAGAR